MKLFVFAGLVLFGGAAVASQGTIVDAHQGGILLAQSHAGHGKGGHAAHMKGDHTASPSQTAIEAMAVSKSLQVSDCWIRLVPAPAPSAGYFVASNTGSDPVTLNGAASASYGSIMLHQTTHEDGMSKMSHVQGAEIPAGQALQFKPGSYHLMLEKPAREIKVGDTVAMQLLLASGEKAVADCEVKPANTLAK